MLPWSFMISLHCLGRTVRAAFKVAAALIHSLEACHQIRDTIATERLRQFNAAPVSRIPPAGWLLVPVASPLHGTIS